MKLIKLLGVLFMLTCAVFGTNTYAGYADDIGYTQLVAEYSDVPRGENLTVMQVEAGSPWQVSPSKVPCPVVFSIYTTPPTATTYSNHANIVAARYVSLLPSIKLVDTASSSYYRYSALNIGNMQAPKVPTWDIENHSYIGDATTYNSCSLGGMDYKINRDGTTVCVSLGNGTAKMIPLMGNVYNSIVVGTSSGNHSRGGTTMLVAGRVRPDICGTRDYTSYTTPIVMGSAGILLEKAKTTAALNNATNSRVIKALLLAGATKQEFPTWANTTSSPLDLIYGAGEVNIYNSYKLLLAGQKSANQQVLNSSGWDYRSTSTSNVYYFEVGDTLKSELSVVLTWNFEPTTSDFFTYTGSLKDLNLKLYKVNSSFGVTELVTHSSSTIDNVEHIYVKNLPAGRYAIKVEGPTNVKYGIAWRNAVVSAIVTAPVIVTQPSSYTVDVGAPVNLSVVATGDDITYQWFKNGAAVSGATSSILALASAVVTDSGVYTVNVTNSAGTITSAPSTVSVSVAQTGDLSQIVPVTYSARGDNAAAKEGINKLFDGLITTKWLDFAGTTWVQVQFASPVVLGSYAMTSAADVQNRDPYNWTVSGSNDGETWTVIDSRSGELFPTRKLRREFTAQQTSLAFTYFRFDIVCKSGSITQLAELQLYKLSSMVQVVPPTVVSSPASSRANEGSSLTLTSEFAGSTPTVQWYMNDQPITGATNKTYTINSVSESHAGNYYAVATNSAGEVETDVAVITVVSLLEQRIGLYSVAHIGSVSSMGSYVTDFDNKTVSMSFNGGGYWGNADSGFFLYKNMTGAFSYTTRLENVDSPSVYSRAGIMARLSLDAGSVYCALFITEGRGIVWQFRTSSGKETLATMQSNVVGPMFLRMVRTSTGVVSGQFSADGQVWQTLGTFTSGLSDVKVGLAGAQDGDTNLGLALFSQIE